MKPRILYVEDDETLAFLTKDNLEQHAYTVIHCQNGQTALKTFKDQVFDLCILDIMLPAIDGFTLSQEIRKRNPDIPILILSAKSLQEDRLKGLRIGADDYLVKPFSMEELLLKIEVFLRRSGKAAQHAQAYTLGSFRFDVSNYALLKGHEKIQLTEKEASLLKLLIDHQNQVLKREQILLNLWGEDDYFMGRSLDVFISRLRKMLAAEEGVKIENLRGIGFRLKVETL